MHFSLYIAILLICYSLIIFRRPQSGLSIVSYTNFVALCFTGENIGFVLLCHRNGILFTCTYVIIICVYMLKHCMPRVRFVLFTLITNRFLLEPSLSYYQYAYRGLAMRARVCMLLHVAM